MKDSQNKIDLNALKFNQASIVTLTLIGFIFNQPYLLVFVGAVVLAGSLNNRFAMFKQFYKYALVPAKILKPIIVEESPAPHNFAQTMGGIFLEAASFFLFNGQIALGWILVWVVILLAAANLFFNFCMGCFIYFQLGKLGIPGFKIKTNNKV